jgi:hypothetical protein
MYFEAVLAVRAPVLNCGSILACSGKASSIETQWTQPPIRTPFQVAAVKRAQLTSILRRVGFPLRYESQLAAPQKLFPGVGLGLAWIVGRAPLQPIAPVEAQRLLTTALHYTNRASSPFLAASGPCDDDTCYQRLRHHITPRHAPQPTSGEGAIDVHVQG